MKTEHIQRFWSKANILGDDDCWDWLVGKKKSGYGQFNIGHKNFYAHRIAWEIYTGKKIERKKVICHKCDNPSCVNPKHLFIGTQKDNIEDKHNKGRAARQDGENNPASKVSWDDVRDIRRMYESGIYTVLEISHLYPISRYQVSNIVRNKSWKTK